MIYDLIFEKHCKTCPSLPQCTSLLPEDLSPPKPIPEFKCIQEDDVHKTIEEYVKGKYL